VTTRDPRPTPAVPGYDPAQLSFGDVAAVPQLRVDQHAAGGDDPREAAAMGFREPPVCGESSYDDVEDAGPSWSVRIVQEAESMPSSQRARPSAARGQAASSPGAARPAGTWTAAAARPSTGVPAAGELDRASVARNSASMRNTGPHPIPSATTAPVRPTPAAMPSAALDPLKRSTELSPRDAEAAIAYANALDKHGNASAALAALDECLATGGDELRLICARVFLLGSRLKYDLAETELRRAAKLRSDDPGVQLQTGILACRRARWRDAVEPLQKAASQRTDDALAHFYLGEALNHVDQLAAALQAYERATRLDPANWRAFKGVGIVLDRLGRPTDAAVAYRYMREAQGR
jgi:Flp pilus assembly protein TadD